MLSVSKLLLYIYDDILHVCSCISGLKLVRVSYSGDEYKNT